MNDPIQPLYELAMESLSSNEIREAEAALRRMLAIDEDDPRTIEVAGDLARERGDDEEAEQQYLLLDLFRDHPEVRGVGKLSLGILAIGRDDREAARDQFREAVGLFEEAGATARLIFALGILGAVCRELGAFQEAAESFQRIVSAIQDSDAPEAYAEQAAEALHDLGNMQRLLGELDEAEEALREAMAWFEALDLDRGKAEVFNSLGIVEQIRGHYDEAERLHLEALAINEAIDNEMGIGAIYDNLTTLCLHRRDLDLAEQYARKAEVIYRRMEHVNGIASAHLYLGQIETERGNLDAAETALTHAERLYQNCGDPDDLVCISSHLGALYRRQGRLDDAEVKTLEAQALAEAIGHGDGIAASYDELALIRKAQGQFDEARALWNRALSLYEDLQSERMIAEVREQLRNLDTESP